MNPFRQWREARNLTRTEMAVLLGTGVSQVQAIESGMPNRPFKSFVTAFALLAGDEGTERLCHEYTSWREGQRIQALAKLREG